MLLNDVKLADPCQLMPRHLILFGALADLLFSRIILVLQYFDMRR